MDMHGCSCMIHVIAHKWHHTFCTCEYSLASQTAPFAMFSSLWINTLREGLGDCLYRFGSKAGI